MLPVQLSSITDGVGKRVEVAFEPLTAPHIHERDTNRAVYPATEVRGAMYVVSRLKATNGVGGMHETSFRYRGGQYHTQGLGFLGFQRIISKDALTGMASHSTYSQRYQERLQNQVEETLVYAPDGETLLSNQTSEHSVNVTFHMDSKVGLKFATYVINTPRVWAEKFGLHGEWLSGSTTETLAYDKYANPEHVVSDIVDPYGRYTKEVFTEFKPNVERWQLALVRYSTAISTTEGKPSLEHNATFERDAFTGYVLKETQFPATSFEKRIGHKYDDYGNQITTTISVAGEESRTTTNTFDELGRYVLNATNPLDQTTSAAFDPRFGVVLSSWDLNGLETTHEYDGLGRPVSSKYADGTTSSVDLRWCTDASTCPDSRAVYYQVDTSRTHVETTAFFDVLRRGFMTHSVSFGGRTVVTETVYDNRGLVAAKSSPRFAGDLTVWTNNTYDVLGRTLSSTLPDGNTTRFEFYGHSTATINALDQRHNTSNNAMGWLMYSTDASGNTTRYDYDSAGHQTKVIDAHGNSILAWFDLAGQRTHMDDPDMGFWKYTYDGLGQLASQVGEGEQRTTSWTYDLLGRKLTETTSGGGLKTLTSHWTYDECSMGVGKVCKVTSANGIIDLSSYDDLGRLFNSTRSVPASVDEGGGTPFDHIFVTSFKFDEFGRISETFYPGGGEGFDRVRVTSKAWIASIVIGCVLLVAVALGAIYLCVTRKNAVKTGEELALLNDDDAGGGRTNISFPRNRVGFVLLIGIILAVALIAVGAALLHQERTVLVGGLVVRNVYDKHDHLTQIYANDTTLLWELKEVNAFGTVINEQFNSGAIIRRHDYDILNRVRGIRTTGKDDIVVQNLHYEHNSVSSLVTRHDQLLGLSETVLYDDLNRMTHSQVQRGSETLASKSFEFDALGNILYKSDVGRYEYDASYVSALDGKRRTRPHAVSSTAGSNSAVYTYDGNGNMLSGNGRTITWNGIEKPSKIIRGTAVDTFQYDANHALAVKHEDRKQSILVGGIFEHVEIADKGNEDGVPSLQHRFMVGDFAVFVTKELEQSSSDAELSFITRDPLGSVDKILSASGEVIQKHSYDVFGLQRDPDTWLDFTVEQRTGGLGTASNITDRGFTNHYELYSVGLVHMGGRVYDPLLGRFISPDPFIQQIDNGQSLNRYSYVMNNPLTFTDPSGFFSLGHFFSGIFHAIGKMFHAIGHALKGLAKMFKHSALLRAVLRFAIEIAICGGPENFGCVVAIDTAYSAFVTKVEGGSWTDALKSAAITLGTDLAFNAVGGLTDQIAKQAGSVAALTFNVAAHAAVGGTSSALQGGKFWTGAAAGAAGSAAGNLGMILGGRPGGFIGATIGGGLGSTISGGSFGEGAAIGAAGAWFNLLGDHKGGSLFKFVRRVLSFNVINRLYDAYADATAPTRNLAFTGKIIFRVATGQKGAPLKVFQEYRKRTREYQAFAKQFYAPETARARAFQETTRRGNPTLWPSQIVEQERPWYVTRPSARRSYIP